MTTAELFEKHDAEHGHFERIPDAQKRHPLRDVCALIYLYETHPPTPGRIIKGIGGADHDIIFLAQQPDDLTDDDVIYLLRCGFFYSREFQSLSMHV